MVGLSLGLRGDDAPVVFRGLGEGLTGEFNGELSQLAGACVPDFLVVLAGVVVHNLGSRLGGP